MFPNIDSVKKICEVSAKEESILLSPESPIVLLKKKANVCSKYFVSEECSPGNPYLGVMLPYTPLHHILLKQLDSPIVATSGNIAEEPMCIDDEDALNRLKDIADYFLINNRPIVRHVDDSIVRVVADREMVTRRARGYAPYPIKIKNKIKNKMIAVGGHLKNTIAMNIDENIFISQHIGNLETSSSMDAFRNVINDFKDMYEFNPDLIIHDIHPEYLSTKYAQSLNKNILSVQHHFAHIASCMAENEIDTECLGVSWDGTGLGFDNNIWGGEFFIVDKDFSYSHAAQFRTFKLPGGEAAIKEARRSALGILYEIYDNGLFEDFNYLINKNFSVSEIKIISSMLLKNINCPTTSSAGRIFDAVSSILNISHVASYEGKSAMMLEYCVDDTVVEFYPFSINENEKLIIDWEETLLSILGDLEMGVDKSIIAAKFHNTMTRIILKVANYFQYKNVVLSGGCFQNAVLLTRTINLLTKNEYKVYWHQRVPTNDGGISLGQIVGSEYSYKDTELKKRVINSIKIGS
jgi:hydrogenase maturation protein HypF